MKWLRLLPVVVLLILVSFQDISAETRIRCASTTSTQNSGLFDYILPLFEKKTGILINKVIIDYLSSGKEQKKFNKYIKSVYSLPILATIPCFCEVLKAAGDYIFSEEKPEHPFSQNLENLAAKVEKF